MKIKPENASCAIIKDKKNNFLLQKRDNKKGIFFPNHWGLFGGAKNNNETYLSTVKREINEELGIKSKNTFFFMNLKFDMKNIINKEINRYCYISEFNDLRSLKIKLTEGEKYKIFNKKDLINFISKKNLIVPYDNLVIWFYLNKKKLISY